MKRKARRPAQSKRANKDRSAARGIGYRSGGLVLALSTVPGLSMPATLPVPCLAGSCGKNASGFVTSGTGNARAVGNTLTVNNLSNSAVLNWSSFNVSADGKVVFSQPSSTSVALNQIWQGSPSTIQGSITANGQIYLVNQNGFVFGANSTINVGGLLASSLALSPDALANGIVSQALLKDGQAALQSDGRTSVLDTRGNPVLGADGKPLAVQIVVEPGAQMNAVSSSSNAGRLMLASQNISNGGTLSAPDGQVVLAAGTKVFLQASSNPDLRGLVVEVDYDGTAGPTSTAWNQLTGSLSAARGNVTMAGLAVNQDGRISATTSVAANGSVILTAASGTQIVPRAGASGYTLQPHEGGDLELGSQSSIEIQPELTSTATAVAAQAQMPSSVALVGQQIVMKPGASITAPGGQVTATAQSDPSVGVVSGLNSAAQLRIDAGAAIDVSGSTAQLSVADNIVPVQLNASQLADDPQNRTGFLHGQTVYVDSRVVTSDGKPGTDVADASSAIAAKGYNVAYRTTKGGTITLESEGDVTVAQGATLNVSGGKTDYAGAVVATTQLIASNGSSYDISQASPNLTYVGLVNPTYNQTYNGWGVTTTQGSPGVGKYQAGYIQGASAGSVQVAAPNIVLNGSLLGSAYNGPFQRVPSSVTNPTTMAAGGLLEIGIPAGVPNTSGSTDFLAPGVQFTAAPPAFVVADGAPFPGQQTLNLPVDYLTQGGFTRTQIYSDQSITLPAGLPLSLAAESSMTLTAPRISIESNIAAPSGSLSFATADTIFDPAGLAPQRQGIDIGSAVALDVRGQWTNDLLTAQGGSQPVGQIAKNGGSIALTLGGTAGELTLGNNSALQASGGAWFSAAHALTGGTGGSISLNAGGFEDALQIGSGVSLDAFGAQTASGGQFSLTANRIEISQGNGWSGGAAQTVDELNAPGVLQLTSGLFSQFGFASVNLAATGSNTVVSAGGTVLQLDVGTSIVAQESNLLLSSQFATSRSGASIMDFSHVSLLPDYSRLPESVSLGYTAFSQSITPNAGEILVGSGAKIRVDPAGTINLSSTGSIDVEGTLQALAGNITISNVVPVQATTVYFPQQGIVLGSGAVIDAEGTHVYTPNTLGLLFGSVYGGGNVSIQAAAGNVTAESGSQIDVHGTTAPLDVINSSGGYSVQSVGTTGGGVSIGSARNIELYGSIDAAAGSGGALSASGGSLTITLEPFSGGLLGTADFTAGTRTIEIVSSALPSPYSAATAGVSYLSAPALEKTGAASITLQTAYSSSTFAPSPSNPDQPGALIQIDPGVSLAVSESLTLDSPVLAMSGGSATLKAPLVTLTNSSGNQLTNSTGGSGALNVQGNFIDLSGWEMLQGIGSAVLSSTGDVRLDSGANPYFDRSGNPEYLGGLSVGGDLTIDAARVYTSTNAVFALTSTGPTGTISIDPSATSSATPAIPLSAGGQLTVNADNIVNSGFLYTPFGEIKLNATTSLVLNPNSVTSVSANGQLIPYGTVINGSVWQPDSAQGGSTLSSIPTRQVSLNAPSITVATGAKVDLSGGGDLYAYQFEPGTGGTTDALLPPATALKTDLFAILPQLQGQYAPYDPVNFAGTGLANKVGVDQGMSVYLSGVPGLAAGVYALLPAQYALLSPGAFLIQEVAGSRGKTAPGASSSLMNGTPEVAGYFTFGNTGLGDGLYSGFAVYPGSYARQLATYQDELASTFFSAAAAQSTQAGAPPPPLPADAGSLIINATASQSTQTPVLSVLGTVLSQAATGGTAADIEISAPNIDVVADSNTAPLAGSVALVGSVVQSWDAGHLLLGGQRVACSSTPCTTDTTISVSAGAITVSKGAILSAQDVELVAASDINVQAGATIASNSGINASAAPNTPPPVKTVALNGPMGASPAFLAVSDTEVPVVSALVGGGAGGSVTLESGSSLKSAGAISIAAPSAINMNGASVSTAGASVSLATGTINFGAVAGSGSTAAGGLTIDSALLASLAQSQSLRLSASDSINLLSDTTLGTATSPLSSLTLVSNAIKASSGTNTTFGARSLTLEGLADPSTTVATGGTGQLTLIADSLTIGSGVTPASGVTPVSDTLALNGMGLTTVQVTGSVSGSGTGAVIFGGDAAITAANITGSSGANLTLAANGKLSLSSSSSGTTPTPASLGAEVQLSGATVDDETSIVVHSGAVGITAANSLTIGPTAVIDTSGQVVTIAGQSTSSPGGVVSLTSGGALTMASGAEINVRGGPQADAGSLEIAAAGAAGLNGSFSGAAGAGARGGSFFVDAGQLSGSFDALVTSVQSGGFSTAQSYRVGSGDLRLDSGQAITANQVRLVADTGSIYVGGGISAPSADLRGAIGLFAGQNVELAAGAVLNANSTGIRGGEIEIGTTSGNVSLDSGSVVSALGSQQMGTLTLRAPQVGTDDVAINPLAGSNLAGLSQVIVEPVLAPTVLSMDPTSTSVLDANTLSGIESNVSAYMSNAPGIISGRLATTAPLTIEPAVDIESAGSVQIAGVDLSTWRFGSNQAPVDLTVRAAGAVEVQGSITDGQMPGQNGVSNSIDLLPGQSSSLSLVAGADRTSADPLGTVAGVAADLTVDAGVIVTTGTGNISLAAARDVVFGGQGATVYTTGILAASSQAIDSNRFSLTAPTSGGNVSIVAGANVVGSPMSQSVSDWQTRTATKGATATTEWGVDLGRFDQVGYNVATLGGGDLTVVANASITNLSAAASDSRIQATPGTGAATLLSSGGLVVSAGRDIVSGQFYLGDGSGRISAGGSLGSAYADPTHLSIGGSLLAQGNSQLTVSARGDVVLVGDVNPSMLDQSGFFGVRVANLVDFISYGDSAALNVSSVSGTLDFDNSDLGTLLGAVLGNQSNATNTISPGTLRAAALAGNIEFFYGPAMAPSPVSQLSLFAGGNISAPSSLTTAGSVAILMSDAPAGSYPTIQSPQSSLSNTNFDTSGAVHADDTQQVQIAAGGDIGTPDGTLQFRLPKSAQITAGQDILNLDLFGQNLSSSGTTLVSAGRDILQQQANVGLQVGGAGTLDVFAGRNINLGNSNGITTVGRLSDPAIVDSTGADINVWAGLGAPANASGLVSTIVAPSPTLQNSLVAFMDQLTGNSDLSYAQAQTAFLALPFASQEPFVANTFFGQLQASGLAASNNNAGYAQGYAAIDALFPNSRPLPGSTATNPYRGDLEMPFSNIYTVSGGAISIVVPGGEIDVGVAVTPPGATAKPPYNLGIVAQAAGNVNIYSSGDVNVDSSRIFSLLGGNILIWSDLGSIDAGRGSKTSVSAPPPQVEIDPTTGTVSLDFSQSVTGSGIQADVIEPGVAPGNVYLIAPVGTVDAGDAGIASAGNLFVSAAHVIVGTGGFAAGGTAVGVPPSVSGLGASLSGASSAASSSTNASTSTVGEGNQNQAAAAPIATATLSWLDVFVEGFGTEECKPDNIECMKRNAAH